MIVLALLALAMGDEPAPAPAARVREDLVVTAERAPDPRDEVAASVSVLTRRQIEALPAANLSELMRYVTGLDVSFGQNFGGTPPIVSARGFFGGGEAEYVQLRIDGVPVGDAESSLADWRALPSSAIERVEVLRGPSSALYGDAALGGVVDVFTRGAGPISASVSGGTFGTASAAVSGGTSRGPFDGGAWFSAGRTDGFRAHAAERDEIASLFGSFRAGSGTVTTLRLSGSSKNREDPGQLPLEISDGAPQASDPIFRFDRERTDRLRASISIEDPAAPTPYRATIYGGLRRTGAIRTLLLLPGVGDRAQRNLRTSDIGIVADARRSFALFGVPGDLRGGIEASREALDGKYHSVGDDGAVGPRLAAASGNRNRLAGFLGSEWRLLPRLRVTAGVRGDRIADSFDLPGGSPVSQAWSPRAGASFGLGPRDGPPVTLFVSAARAFKAPTLDQLFDPRPFPDFQGGTFTVSNPSLRPQHARSIEAGARASLGLVRLEAAAYRIGVEDEIDFDPATFRYRNIGRSLHRGVETEIRVQPSSRLSVWASYDWTRVENRDSPGTQLKNIPEHHVRAAVGLQLPAGLEADAIGSWMGRRFADDANRFRMSDVVVADLRVTRRWGPLRARVDAVNLTDARYSAVGFTLPDLQGGEVAYAYPAPRRAIRLSIEWSAVRQDFTPGR